MAWPSSPQGKPAQSLRQALTYLHHPTPDVSIAALEDRSHPAWQRLKAEELLAQQLSQRMAKLERDTLKAPALKTKAGGWHDKLKEVLPFQLTAAQQRVGLEIAQDLARPVPMHRLLQGDVGAGKTVVAALAAMLAIDQGWQCALMAPTEILAQQHFAKLVGWLAPLGVRVAWLTGSQKKKERTEMLALINLALAIIDEQHRFGVAQRLALRDKMQDVGMEPHLLMMTATPIPRTLAMSYYADLEVSVIDELPPGRTPVVTKVISDSRRDQVIGRIGAQLAEGRQVYWVCPLIEESEALDLTNATATHEELSAVLSAQLPGTTVGLLHSRMSVNEKREVMAQFTQGSMGVLVSTT
ncbi:MAG: ATP-dependent helicase RecG, partial [Pseudomonadota bacterium]